MVVTKAEGRGAKEAGRRCPSCGGRTDDRTCPKDGAQTIATDPAQAAAEEELGSVIAGKYRLEAVIGRGGFGAVYQARHAVTGQGVALKLLTRHHDPVATTRFFQEAQATSRLSHPNTIRLYDFGEDDRGRLYLVMELLTGRTLRDTFIDTVRRRGVFTQRETVEIGVAILKSLTEAHRQGLVHRDIKPDNIFLHQVEGEDPIVKVLDFGIAKLRDSPQELTSRSAIPGTPAFMSPEQALNRDLDGRSDLYGLGVMLFTLVSGRLPFRGEGPLQTLYMHVNQPAPDLRKAARTAVTDDFVEVVRRALEKDPERRFPDARAMRTALSTCGTTDHGLSATSTVGTLALDQLGQTGGRGDTIEELDLSITWAEATPPPTAPPSLEAVSLPSSTLPALPAGWTSDSEAVPGNRDRDAAGESGSAASRRISPAQVALVLGLVALLGWWGWSSLESTNQGEGLVPSDPPASGAEAAPGQKEPTPPVPAAPPEGKAAKSNPTTVGSDQAAVPAPIEPSAPPPPRQTGRTQRKSSPRPKSPPPVPPNPPDPATSDDILDARIQ